MPAPSTARDGPLIGRPDSSLRLNTAFFLFGLLNNSLYVVILTAALELLPQGVPTGLVAFANIFPALIAKAVWPYVLKGRVRYTRRVWSCAALSFVGMIMISLFPSLAMRLLGISLASFSSGLGELTFLQLSTTYAPKDEVKRSIIPQSNYAGDSIGWFASGTGAAGLVGAAAWWIVRPLGVQLGLGILSLLPGFMLASYSLLLPSAESLLGAKSGKGAYEALPTAEALQDDDEEEEEDEATAGGTAVSDPHKTSSPERLDEENDTQDTPIASSSSPGNVLDEEPQEIKVRLSFQDKMALLKSMLWIYILPLVTVYFAEYTINQGVAPTLVYPLPTRSQHPLLGRIIRKLSDYYPLYQLVYQTFVFISRSSISIFRLPAIPKQFLWLPALLQTGLLCLLISESLHAWFKASIASPLVIVLICVEGLAGGAAYVSVFYSIGLNEQSHVQLNDEAAEEDEDTEKRRYRLAREAQEHEFRIGCVGFGDSLGILVASLVSMPLQVGLCNAAAKAGRDLCKQL